MGEVATDSYLGRPAIGTLHPFPAPPHHTGLTVPLGFCPDFPIHWPVRLATSSRWPNWPRWLLPIISGQLSGFRSMTKWTVLHFIRLENTTEPKQLSINDLSYRKKYNNIRLQTCNGVCFIPTEQPLPGTLRQNHEAFYLKRSWLVLQRWRQWTRGAESGRASRRRAFWKSSLLSTFSNTII